MVPCPGCNGDEFTILVPRERVAEEIAFRQKFFLTRLDGPLDPAEQKDRADVAHASEAEILICRRCDILVRREDERPDFEADRYAPFTMERMLRAHIDAYRRKEPLYRHLLPEHASVVEVGSYVGGFLHVANEWGWRAVGVDVGGDTVQFARAHAYDTRDQPLEECGFENASFDGVFIWNTFEQLPDPHRVLREVRRILKPGGALVIRTPNAAYYMASKDLVALAHANLLGFPHMYGYTPASLEKVVAPHGFKSVQQIGDRHIMPSLRPLNAMAVREAERVEAIVPLPPWFEMTFR